ncbi:DUF2750 domain-containing protein [Streptomyces sp. NPDC059447]|uniref:DUF2750 domain-containing protein n=1 Tax=Streptomyces sp. NPDC059447 TaxID=3346834 RepID=UPI0036AADA5F
MAPPAHPASRHHSRDRTAPFPREPFDARAKPDGLENRSRNEWRGSLGSEAMSQSDSQAAAFFRDVHKSRVVWLVRDEEGMPTHHSADGTRSLPFWSTSAHAQRAAKIWGAWTTR